MKQIFKWMVSKKTKKRKALGSGTEWMRGQIQQMNKMNQGIVSMALGRE